ncbi:hypothetical protein [Merismopedia glauca]|uniref:DUF1311 domain-containing protein n=1 Tax=Merismopedia glauca CCAP 1448/3 TaxID=1296344 RepID=A0A2T1C7K4_9CYAN|nr:hypothetical protein [Merismopedia glauca]PSB04265.1 hypothetical protein C7B64_04710 [Merismopedia glauca CCAP 1448/3]
MNKIGILACLAIAGSLLFPAKSYAEEFKYKKFERTAAEDFCYKLPDSAYQNYTKSTYENCARILEQYQARITANKQKTLACVNEYYAQSGISLGRISLDCMDYIEVIR